jgi:hypothetical protein
MITSPDRQPAAAPSAETKCNVTGLRESKGTPRGCDDEGERGEEEDIQSRRVLIIFMSSPPLVAHRRANLAARSSCFGILP